MAREDDKIFQVPPEEALEEERKQTKSLADISETLVASMESQSESSDHLASVLLSMNNYMSHSVIELQKLRERETEREKREEENRQVEQEREDKKSILERARERASATGDRVRASSFVSGMGNLARGASGLFGSLISGIMGGVGIAAGGLGVLLMIGQMVDASKIKENVEILLSIGSDVTVDELDGRFGTVAWGLTKLGFALVPFSAGGTFAAAMDRWGGEDTEWSNRIVENLSNILYIGSPTFVWENRIHLGSIDITSQALSRIGWALMKFGGGSIFTNLGDWIGGDDWSSRVVENVQNLLSISSPEFQSKYGGPEDVKNVTGMLSALAFGLASFGVGEFVQSIGDAVSAGVEWFTGQSWSETLKTNVENILSITNLDGVSRDNVLGLGITLAAIGGGLVAFGVGNIFASVGEGAGTVVSWFTGQSWSESLVGHVETLLSIADMSTTGDGSKIFSTLGTLGAAVIGFNLFSIGQSVIKGASGLVGWLYGKVTGDTKTWSENIRDHVFNLLSIVDEVDSDGESKAAMLGPILGSLGEGIHSFSTGMMKAGDAAFLEQIQGWFFGDSDWSTRMVNHIRSLSDISRISFGEMTGSEFGDFMNNLGDGIRKFSEGGALQTITGFLESMSGNDWSIDMGRKIENITSITSAISVEDADKVMNVLVRLGIGIKSFAENANEEYRGFFSHAGEMILGFFGRSDDSVIGQLKSVLDSGGDMEIVSNTLETFTTMIDNFKNVIYGSQDYRSEDNIFLRMAQDVYSAAWLLSRIPLSDRAQETGVRPYWMVDNVPVIVGQGLDSNMGSVAAIFDELIANPDRLAAIGGSSGDGIRRFMEVSNRGIGEGSASLGNINTDNSSIINSFNTTNIITQQGISLGAAQPALLNGEP